MIRTGSCVLLLAATFLIAADNPAVDPAWKTRRVEQWDTEDAKQFLAASPWVGHVSLQWIPDRSPDQRRDSGDWDTGVGKGVGLEGIGIFGGERARQAIERAHEKPDPGMVDIRWESGLPVRAAEEKIGQTPTTQYKDFYVITVYDVPLPESRWGAEKLKGLAYLKRENKKDFKPSRVEVVRKIDGKATVTFLFNRSEEIARRDKTVIFVAQFDRLFLSQFFYPREMVMRGQMEL